MEEDKRIYLLYTCIAESPFLQTGFDIVIKYLIKPFNLSVSAQHQAQALSFWRALQQRSLEG